MSFYRTGTISLTNGSTAVTGVGTNFIAGTAIGECLQAPDGKLYEILAVTSATGLTLGQVYLGATASTQPYSIVPTQSYIRDLASQAASLVNGFQSTKDNALTTVATAKTTLVDADSIGVRDSVTGLARQITVANLNIGQAASTQTLTNKTINLANNTLVMTSAQLAAAITDESGTGVLALTASPAFTGVPTAPLAVVGDKSDTLASTAFVQREKEYLPALSQSLHYGAIVKSIVYDTSKDSDGGAWRKRCQDKSWFKETLGGDRWLGQLASVALAWAASGNAVGAVYQSTADGKYYTPISATVQTEVFRGITREFPAVSAIVAESGRVVIYDLTKGGAMWMVFVVGPSYVLNGSLPAGSLAAVNGAVIVGNAGATNGTSWITFISDSVILLRVAAQGSVKSYGLSARNNACSFAPVVSYNIVNTMVNDVAITALPDAPIDPATGLPVPTIAVATAGGVSVIKQDGTVVNSAGGVLAYQVGFSADRLVYGFDGGDYGFKSVAISALAAGFTGNTYLSAAIPCPTTHQFFKPAGSSIVGRGGKGVCVFKENPATPAKGMVSYITNAYNSGWLPGDIRGAYLADTTAETITASGELITNGTFTTDTSGWSALSATLSVVSNKLHIVQSAPNGGAISSGISTVIGETYSVACDFTKTTLNATLSVTNSAVGGGSFAAIAMTATGFYILNFVATATTTYIVPYITTGVASDVADFDNISVKLAEPDRSVKNLGLVLTGTLTKTAVASGANLMGYSGFSAANYLEQPSSANLDFGTGDFCIMGWVRFGIGESTYGIMSRTSSGSTGWHLYRTSSSSTSVLAMCVGNNGTGAALAAGTRALNDTQPHHFCVVRRAGLITLYTDGVQDGTPIAMATSIDESVPLRVGLQMVATLYMAALFRIGTTAPSADQIAHIYRTELPLFQAGAQCTLAGTSTFPSTLAYDEATDLLHVGTSWGRSGFKDLLRVDSEATTTGALTSLSAQGGVILTGGTSAKVYVPAMTLREELRRKDEARAALGKVPVFFDFTATASQTAFALPAGYSAKAIYKNGTMMREATTGVYWTRSNDGFKETCTLSVGATVSDWVSIMSVRSN